jgi:hypothetical protein
VDIVWESNPKPCKSLLCEEKTDIVSADTVTFTFK